MHADGGMYYCLINNLPEEKKDLSKLCSTLTEHEVQYFKILVRACSMRCMRPIIELLVAFSWTMS